MSWLQIVLGLIKLSSVLAQYVERRGYLKAGEAAAIAAAFQKESQDVEIALAARRDARDAVQRNPSGVRDDDGFKRPD